MDTAGTNVPPGVLCPKIKSRTAGFVWVFVMIMWIFYPDKLLSQRFLILSTPPPLTAGKHNTTPITSCSGYNPAQLVFTTPVTGGSPPYSYQWQLNNMAVPGEILAVFDPPRLTIPGRYSYNCSISDAAGSVVFTALKVITIFPDPSVVITGAGVVCQNIPVILNSLVTDGVGTFYYQWQWSANDSLYSMIIGATDPTFSPVTSEAGTGYYRVTIFPNIGACNNATSDALPVIVTPLPVTSFIYHF
ncbi:MAG: SprB repeat-containing protein [Bacteroidales bacterium]|jgi:hypothetical protein